MSKQSIKVLVVDDDEFFRVTIRDALQEAGMTVIEASDAEQATGLITGSGADVMVLDFLLPAATGLDILNIARQRNVGLAQRTIMLTGVMDGPERSRLADDTELVVLAKPFEPDVLVHLIQRLVQD